MGDPVGWVWVGFDWGCQKDMSGFRRRFPRPRVLTLAGIKRRGLTWLFLDVFLHAHFFVLLWAGFVHEGDSVVGVHPYLCRFNHHVRTNTQLHVSFNSSNGTCPISSTFKTYSVRLLVVF